MRRLLEGEAAILAATSLNRAVLAGLIAESHTILADKNLSFEKFWRYDDRFHQAIAEAGGKPVLSGTIVDLRSKARMCHIKRMPGRFEDQTAEHLAVLHDIEVEDGRAAKKAMNRHFDRVRARLLSWLGAR